jgi:UDP-N-acetylmuramate dehydrogenase
MSDWAGKLKLELAENFRGEIFENTPLKDRTTYRIGGPARLLLCPQDLDDLFLVCGLIKQRQLPSFILGGGANVLVADAGFSGAVVHLQKFNQLTFEGSRAKVGAGVLLDDFVTECLKRGLSGLERLSGIPGTLGGALRMNAGAFDAEIADCIVSVECMDQNGNHRNLGKSEIGFSYRRAPAIRDTYILGATFEFLPQDKESLFMTRQDILFKRRERQPWQYPSAGSVFKRPVGYYTGKLIEELGLKGKTVGRAQISPKHAGIIINLGNASAEDVRSLIRLAREEVRHSYKIELELEQELVGFDLDT